MTVYEHAAAGIYGVPVSEITKEQRSIGKIAVLALGFGGGVKAFQNMAKSYGVLISEDKSEEIKTAWRKNNPKIVKYWKDVEDASIEAVLNTGKKVEAGKYITFRLVDNFLWCRLPSGRTICYPYPEIVDTPTPYGTVKQSLVFFGTDSTYGGKLVENITQGVARDLLAEAILRLEQEGFPVVMHVHDEVLCEVSIEAVDSERFKYLISIVPEWANELPISAECWKGMRYIK